MLALAACGTSRNVPDGGRVDSGIGPHELAVVLTAEPFAAQTLTSDFGGDLVAAEPSRRRLHVLDSSGLAPLSSVDLDDGGWDLLGASTGPGGASVLATRDGDVYALDLAEVGGTRIATGVGSPVLSVAATVDGAWLGTGDGGLFFVDGSDAGPQLFTLSGTGERAVSLAVGADGRLVALLASDAGCDALQLGAFPDAGRLEQLFGAPPCALALSHDGHDLWLAAGGDGGVNVYLLAAQSPSMSAARSWNLEGMSGVTRVTVAQDSSRVAILGSAPGPTVAEARTVDLDLAVPFKTVPASQVKSATDAVFDDTGALYVADPLAQSIDLVR